MAGFGFVRDDGDDNNAGVMWNNSSAVGASNDRAFNNSPVIVDGATITATVHTTTTQVNITGYTALAGDLDNTFRISGGSATAGYYRITAVDTVNNRYTLASTAGTAGQTATGRIGGAFATPGQATSIAASLGDGKIYVRKATNPYLVTATLTGPQNSGAGNDCGFEGYETTLGDRAGRPTLKANAGSFALLTMGSNRTCVRNLILDGNSQTSIKGIALASQSMVESCKFLNCTNSAMSGNTATVERCEATGCSGATVFSGVASMVECEAYANTVTVTDCGTVIDCLIYSNTGSTTDAIANASNQPIVKSCVIYGNGRHGMNFTGLRNGFSIRNNIVCNNGGAGWTGSWPADIGVKGNFFRNNTSGNGGTTTYNTTLTSDPFVDPTNGNFALNNTAGGGAVVRAAGVPNTWPRGTTTGYRDGGPVQHQDSGGGSAGPLISMPF